jgi:hypothetical protein
VFIRAAAVPLSGLSCLVRPGFFLSFYFWLDTVAVLSLAFELPALRAVLLLGETQVGVRVCVWGGDRASPGVTCGEGAAGCRALWGFSQGEVGGGET